MSTVKKADSTKPVFVEGGRWCKHNICQSVALLTAYPNLNASELAVLDYITSWSEREKALSKDEIALALSYEEVQIILNIPARNKTTAKRILNNLCKYGLISKVNPDNRKGRSKYAYVPNTNKIRSAIKKHLECNECDREP